MRDGRGVGSMWGDLGRSMGCYLEGQASCCEQVGVPPASGLPIACSLPFITALVLSFTSSKKSLGFLSVQSEKATGQENHSCHAIYVTAPHCYRLAAQSLMESRRCELIS
jgi:hypothetical protein